MFPSAPYEYYVSLDQMKRSDLKREIDRAVKNRAVGERADLILERAKVVRAGLNREGALRDLERILAGDLSARRSLFDEALRQEAEIRLEFAAENFDWALAGPTRDRLLEHLIVRQSGDDIRARLRNFARSRALVLDETLPETDSRAPLLHALALSSFASAITAKTPPKQSRQLLLMALLAEKTAAEQHPFPANRWNLLFASFYARSLADMGVNQNEFIEESWALYQEAVQSPPTLEEIESGRFTDRDFDVLTRPADYFKDVTDPTRLPQKNNPRGMTLYLRNHMLAEILLGEPYAGRRGRDAEFGEAIVRLGPPDQISIEPEVGEANEVGETPAISSLASTSKARPIQVLGTGGTKITFTWDGLAIEGQMANGGRIAPTEDFSQRMSAGDALVEMARQNDPTNEVGRDILAYDGSVSGPVETALAWSVPSETTWLDADGRIHSSFRVAIVPPKGDISWGAGRAIALRILRREPTTDGAVVQREIYRSDATLSDPHDVRTLPTGEQFYVVSQEFDDLPAGHEYQLVASCEAKWPETEGQSFPGVNRFIVDALGADALLLEDARMYAPPLDASPEEITGLPPEQLEENPLYRVAQGTPFLAEVPFHGARFSTDGSFDLHPMQMVFAAGTFDHQVAPLFREKRERADAVDLGAAGLSTLAIRFPAGSMLSTLVPPIEPIGVFVEQRARGRGAIRVCVTTGGLSPGRYVLMVQLEDRNAGEIAHVRLDFGVTSPGELLSPESLTAR